MKYLITGDIHGNVNVLINRLSDYNPEETAIILLGDVGLNYGREHVFTNDRRLKEYLQDSGFIFYCLRGNHEERPQNVPGMEIVYDGEVNNEVYLEYDFPNIRYLMDGKIYMFNDFSCLALGGAYSVDKYWRLANGRKWFPEEQLTEKEQQEILANVRGLRFDFILSHTCPYSWRPTDLFLDCVDQTTVDNTMELWMEVMKNKWKFDYWLFGHYHADRAVRPDALMFYQGWLTLDEIPAAARGEIERFELDPKYYYKTLD
jgi:3-oxoacid CoA-transferase subunit A